MILHLSASLGKSINDCIPKEDVFYASINDATRMLSALGKGAVARILCNCRGNPHLGPHLVRKVYQILL